VKSDRISLACAAFCAFAAAWLFSPVLSHVFVNLEDYWLIVANPHLRGLSFSELGWMFTSLDYGTYQPLGWLAYAVIYAWQGLNPSAYHLGSWLTHAACAVLLYFVTVRILAESPVKKTGTDGAVSLAGAIAVLVWAFHPMSVEPVAWATGLPDLLATMFFLAAVLAYLPPPGTSSRKEAPRGTLGVCLLLYLVSGLFRWKGVSLPVVLLALDVVILRRDIRFGLLIEKLPFLAVAAAFGAVNAQSKLHLAPGHAVDAGLHTLAGPMFYLGKILVPVHLTVDYWIGRSPLQAGGFVLLTGALLWSRRARPAAAAWVCFAAALLPSLVMSFHGRVVAHDRSVYLPALSLAVALAGGLLALLRGGRLARAAALSASAGVLAIFIVLSRAQMPVWADSESLWRHVLVEPMPPDYSHLNLANALFEQGRREEAAAELSAQLRLFPGDRRAEGLARELRRPWGATSLDPRPALPYNH